MTTSAAHLAAGHEYDGAGAGSAIRHGPFQARVGSPTGAAAPTRPAEQYLGTSAIRVNGLAAAAARASGW